MRTLHHTHTKIRESASTFLMGLIAEPFVSVNSHRAILNCELRVSTVQELPLPDLVCVSYPQRSCFKLSGHKNWNLTCQIAEMSIFKLFGEFSP